MKTYFSSIICVVCMAGSMSCNQFRQSITDTLEGSPDPARTESSSHENEGEHHTTISVSGSKTTTVTEHHSSSSTTVTSGATATPVKSLLTNKMALYEAEQALRDLPAYTGKEIYLYKTIHFYDDGRINIKVRHPENPDYVDEYSFHDGNWDAPKPVQLSVHDNIKKYLVNLSDVSFVNAAVVYRNYRQKADSITGVVPINYIYAGFDNNKITWYPQSIDGSRERYFISFTPRGEVDRFYRQ
ncbi:hypothetical protein [Chitinophaga nivalis]|uniref:Beta-lactamase-inhibitor-like PepSY-like domain-containing protein n=1 Tax=Chitinophaga nivalis TaxID=2991709 RepID=A0ABT3IM31_9BACT|nr:hypothetical protein [Chitinophaga nivalis]MCW3465299.1 hypothetical protein [Chitinophaga nivalis]MCW3485009.1 hypothetical protein [Chitinophaga nivalis]